MNNNNNTTENNNFNNNNNNNNNNNDTNCSDVIQLIIMTINVMIKLIIRVTYNSNDSNGGWIQTLWYFIATIRLYFSLH